MWSVIGGASVFSLRSLDSFLLHPSELTTRSQVSKNLWCGSCKCIFLVQCIPVSMRTRRTYSTDLTLIALAVASIRGIPGPTLSYTLNHCVVLLMVLVPWILVRRSVMSIAIPNGTEKNGREFPRERRWN